MSANPFKPSPGSSPPELIGRQRHLDDVRDAIADGPGAPGRTTLFTGPRGVGKTVMLNEVEAAFDRAGWLHLSETATPGLVGRILRGASRLLRAEEPPAKGRVTGVRLPGGAGIDLQRPAQEPADLRETVEHLSDLLGRRDSGLLLTVDEIHAGQVPELRELAVLSQHLVRDDREFALCMAGLPYAISSLLNDDVLTFLRRADRHVLGALDLHDVEDAFVETFADNGRIIDVDACRRAAEATEGYPFLVQLIGHQIWRSTDAVDVGAAAVDRAVAQARTRLGELLHEPALRFLSDVDRQFLRAMAEDSGPSRVGDVAERLGRDAQYVNTYRRRLIAAGVVEPAGRGRLEFTIPYLGDTLRRLDE
jgi:hypothetical protein